MSKLKKDKIRLFEVGPRDGLQNEKRWVPTPTKIQFINKLLRAGIKDLEIGAFVRPDRVPQMKDTATIVRKFAQNRVRSWCLVPNDSGMDRALEAGNSHIAVFTAATDGFTRKNIGMSVADSIRAYASIMERAKAEKIQVRAYVSTAFGCPYEGRVSARKALRTIEKLAKFDFVQISIGDTIGVATPNQIDDVMQPALKMLGRDRVAIHLHDTRGGALANSLRAYELGVRTFDTSAGGLGGCPYAPGASGNLATEDLLYMFHGMGVRTGVRLDSVCEASLWLAKRMKRPLSSQYLKAYAAQKKKS